MGCAGSSGSCDRPRSTCLIGDPTKALQRIGLGTENQLQSTGGHDGRVRYEAGRRPATTTGLARSHKRTAPVADSAGQFRKVLKTRPASCPDNTGRRQGSRAVWWRRCRPFSQLALIDVVPPTNITAVVNVADDVELHGLRISPDIDTIHLHVGRRSFGRTWLGPRRRNLAGHGDVGTLRRQTTGSASVTEILEPTSTAPTSSTDRGFDAWPRSRQSMASSLGPRPPDAFLSPMTRSGR